MTSASEQIVRTLDLRPLNVCNGYFRETWRDDNATMIYWLLPREHHAGWHAAAHPEIFTHHSGDPLRITLLDPAEGEPRDHVIGPDIEAGQHPHFVVPGGVVQAARTLGDHSLTSVVVSPPFTPDIVSTPDVEDLCAQYPDHAERIRALA
ncbi:cupin domain-containing protein [Saccharopolyspora erythraea]|uniref:cupin domain-containing protein n=1 Tax=Saccharopolyspora erythraea TaxID=1836 RepID=UPI001BA759E1|nr:cupin domain-containing protein [Saccharopolyspora erythraea]QUH03254.1 cupin domain-containing protein [Saccharopolyspora erythraea]